MADEADPNHDQASAAFLRAIEDREEILIHSYVLAEATAVLQRRLGLDSALRFLQQSRQFTIHWVGPDDHQAAVELLTLRGRRQLGLVDCASFVVMRRYGLTEALAFDPDFDREGFLRYRATRQ
jgi:predicted nucleic acid-binding protein